MIGALKDGTKEVIALHDGHRESKLSWKEVLSDLKARGLKELPKLAIGDGALGFWAALREQFPATGQQRCWVHGSCCCLLLSPSHPLHGEITFSGCATATA